MSELNEYEATNINAAIGKYLVLRMKRKGFVFDHFFSLTLHEEMLGNVWEWAGKTRQVDLNMGCSWYLVEQQLYSLFQDLPLWKDDPWLEQAAMLHHRAVSIHPFPEWKRSVGEAARQRLAEAEPPTVHRLAGRGDGLRERDQGRIHRGDPRGGRRELLATGRLAHARYTR